MRVRKTKAERKARERELAAERAAWAVQFDVPMPSHSREKLGLGSKIGEALSLKGTALNWGGVHFDEGKCKGEPTEKPPFQTPPAADLGANVERAEQAMQNALELRKNHPALWNIRGGAKRIAAEEGIGISTVYAHMARLRKV